MLQCSSQPFNVTSFPRCFSAVHNHSMWCLLQAWLYDLLYEWSLYYGNTSSTTSTLAPLRCRSQPFQLFHSCSTSVQISAIPAVPLLLHSSADLSHSSCSSLVPLQCRPQPLKLPQFCTTSVKMPAIPAASLHQFSANPWPFQQLYSTQGQIPAFPVPLLQWYSIAGLTASCSSLSNVTPLPPVAQVSM